MLNKTILDIIDLSISFGNKKNLQEVVHAISFSISENEILGIVGESGSGKSVTALSLMGLLPKKNTQITGEVIFDQNQLSRESSES